MLWLLLISARNIVRLLFKNHVYVIFESGLYFVFWCGYNLQRDTIVLFSRVWNHSALAQVQLLFESSIYSSAASDLSYMAYQITAHLLWSSSESVQLFLVTGNCLRSPYGAVYCDGPFYGISCLFSGKVTKHVALVMVHEDHQLYIVKTGL